MKATILTIGDELLIGQVQDTNAAWLARELNGLGIAVRRVVTVGDDSATIGTALSAAMAASGLVLATGGLGPTHDDVTREAVAAHFGVPLHVHADVLRAVEHFFAERGRAMPPLGERVALVPNGFTPLANAVGTAPGLWYEGAATLVLLPGVPREMKSIYHQEIVPRLQRLLPEDGILHRTLCTAGIGESDLQELIGDISCLAGPDLSLASLPRPGQVRLRLTARGRAAAARLHALETHVRARVRSHVYGTDEDTLEGVLGAMLRCRGLTVAVAESCTGGLVLHRLTNVPGASDYVVGGVVAYADSIKRCLMGVPAAVLETEGAVSRTVALQMARSVRGRFGASIGVGVTGIAGPGGGSVGKPVGTTWIAFSDGTREVAVRHLFGRHREANKIRSAVAALDLVRRQLLEAL